MSRSNVGKTLLILSLIIIELCFAQFAEKISGCDSNETDELRCEIEHCSSKKEKFLCDDKTCLDLEYVCDGYCDCKDCSDEHNDCSRIDPEILVNCSHSYFPTPLTPQCIRDLIVTTNTTESPLKIDNLDECTSKHYCDQTCALYKGRALCSCNENYTRIPNNNHGGFRCQNNELLQNATLIHSTATKMKSRSLFTGKIDTIRSIEGPVFAAAGENFYYTKYSDNNQIIFKYSTTTKKEDRLNETMSELPITSIAVDYITNNVYFIRNATLFVWSNFKNTQNEGCFKLTVDYNVSHVALAPIYGWMFYVKQLKYRAGYIIMKSDMDGTEADVFIDANLRQSTPLTVDESIKRVYWLDQDNKTILSASFFGGNSEIRIFQYSGKVLSIAAFDSRVFFTKDHDSEIHILKNNEHFAKSIDENAKIKRYRSNLYYDGLLDFSADSKNRLIDGNLPFEVEYLYAYNPAQQHKQEEKNPCRNSRSPCLLRSKKINSADVRNNCSFDGNKENNDRNFHNEPSCITTNTTNSTPRPQDNTTESKTLNTSSTPTNEITDHTPTPPKSPSSSKPNHNNASTTASTSTNENTNYTTTSPQSPSPSANDHDNTRPSNITSAPINETTPTPSTENLKATPSTDPEESYFSIVVFVIVFLALIVCGVYFYRRRGGYSRFQFQNIRWRRNNDRMNFSHQEI